MPVGSSSLSMAPLAEDMLDATKQLFQRLGQTKVVHHEATDHEFEKLTLPKGPTRCSQCDSMIIIGQDAKICKHCNLVGHDECFNSLKFKCLNSSMFHPPKHRFKRSSYDKPTYCKHCGCMIYGAPFLKIGLSCQKRLGGCGMNIHFRCQNLVCRPCRVIEDTREPANVGVKDFEFIEELGSGSFGRVFLAKMKRNGKKFAVKVVDKSNQTISSDPESVLTEMRALQFGEHHPFLTHVKCCFQTKERLYFVIEYVDGESLFVHLQKAKKFTENCTRFYAAEIALAVNFLHNKGVVYRDLKLENAIIGRDGHCKLIDFGMSKFLDQTVDMKTRTFCGTPYYISPEMIEGLEYSFSCDWWALGVLMYELLVGVLPFNLSDAFNEPEALYRMIVEEKLIVPKYSSSEAKDLLVGLLSKAPEERLGWATLQKHQFFLFKNRDGSREHQWDAIEKKQIKPPPMPIMDKEYDPNFVPPAELSTDMHTISNPSGPFSKFTYCSSSFKSLLEIKTQP